MGPDIRWPVDRKHKILVALHRRQVARGIPTRQSVPLLGARNLDCSRVFSPATGGAGLDNLCLAAARVGNKRLRRQP